MNAKVIRISDFQDKFIKCCDCGDEFVFTPGEQAYFTSLSLSEPKRCKPCRDYRRVKIVIADTDKVGDGNG